MTNDHAGFLLAIAAGDRWARESYLDWLTERDDPRAKFIRVQECLASELVPEDGWNDTVTVFQEQQTKLLTAHERDWRGAIVCGTCNGYRCTHGPKLHPTGCMCCHDCRGTGFACWPLLESHTGPRSTPYCITATFRRGFVHTVRATLNVLLAPGVAEAIGRYHPLERVVATDRHPDESFWWWRDGRDTFNRSRAYLPNDVFNKLDHPHILGMNGVHYETLEEALDALSAALLPWFRPQTIQEISND